MKRIKSTMLCMMALMTLSLMFVNVLTVQAAKEKTPGGVYVEAYTDSKGNVKEQKKFRAETYETTTIDVEYGPSNRIKDLKVSKKGMTAKVTYEDSDPYYDGDATISLYPTKTGTYTVSFKVVDGNGKSRKSYKLKVLATNDDRLIKKATFGKKTVVQHSASIKNGTKKVVNKNSCKVSGKSGKLKITPNSQYKITGIVVATVGKSGQYSYKKIKNGRTISLSKAYAYSDTDAYSSTHSRPSRKYTYIYVSYKDKFLGNSVTYSVSKKRGRKEIKEVSSDRYGKSTYYSKNPGANITLWQY